VTDPFEQEINVKQTGLHGDPALVASGDQILAASHDIIDHAQAFVLVAYNEDGHLAEFTYGTNISDLQFFTLMMTTISYCLEKIAEEELSE